ncbi:MAG: fluoride ion transporter CrcB [Methylophilaceae bacterium 17-44-8]|jgi:CrcB protein|nr:MAG: fluoride ion transporter CrcB [Methylophilales bacterium 28-44-11]OZA06877.1 MAG: fluoride ion transporter CrcB [Methylophilaceae bacterium 17-44-8]
MINAFVAVGFGAAIGAWLRWGLGILLNASIIPMGTLLANLLGGYLMGLALAGVVHQPSLSPEMKLFITTGFLGGLTTFSTFSAEAFNLMHREQYGYAVAHVLLHVIGSLIMTALGYLTVQYFKH